MRIALVAKVNRTLKAERPSRLADSLSPAEVVMLAVPPDSVLLPSRGGPLENRGDSLAQADAHSRQAERGVTVAHEVD
jgi:hypothetical protein